MGPNTNPVLTGFALLLLVGLPALAAYDARRGLDPAHLVRYRRAVYGSVSLSLMLIAGLTYGVARWQGLSGGELGWRVDDTLIALGWAVGATVVGLAAVWALTGAARRIGLAESRIATLLMPRTPSETRGFLILSGVAAVAEEYVFRGFLQHVLSGWVSSAWIAVGIVSLSFGLAHGYQKLAGIARATVLGFVLAVPVLQTGSLFPAIAAHFWVNAGIGLGLWKHLVSEQEAREIEAIIEEANSFQGTEGS